MHSQTDFQFAFELNTPMAHCISGSNQKMNRVNLGQDKICEVRTMEKADILPKRLDRATASGVRRVIKYNGMTG